MRIGLIARMDNSGLGIQTHEFYMHMRPSKTLVVDMSGHNNNRQYPERYTDHRQPGMQVEFSHGIPTNGAIHEFLDDLDCLFVAEAPYNYFLYEAAKQRHVKTAVQYNYEFLDWFLYGDLPKPDMLIAPSRWHFDEMQAWCETQDIKHVYLHCPVNRVKLPYREITQAKTFLHIVGRAAAHDRNGTETVIAASQFLNTDAHILIHFQGEQGIGHQVTHTIDDYERYVYQRGNRNKVSFQQKEFDNYNEIYQQGDVLVLPRRYGGNCLPMNEALSTGMPVIMPNISPNNAILDTSWLVSAEKVDQFTPRTVVDIYGCDPRDLAAKIDEFYNMPAEQMLAHNQIANAIASKLDWSVMKKEYFEALESLCKGQ